MAAAIAERSNVLSGIPDPEAIQRELGETLRRTAFLRRLLKLAKEMRQTPPGLRACGDRRELAEAATK